MVTIKVAGSLKGVVRVVSLDSTIGELRAECSRLLGGVSSRLLGVLAEYLTCLLLLYAMHDCSSHRAAFAS